MNASAIRARCVVLAARRVATNWRVYAFAAVWTPLSLAILYSATREFEIWNLLKVLLGFEACAGIMAVFLQGSRQAEKILLHAWVRPSVADPALPHHRVRVVEELLRVAALVDRACLELAYRVNPPLQRAGQGTTRLRTLNAVRRPGVWDGLTAQERDLLTSPEGSWPATTGGSLLLRAEDVRVLRWAIGVDPILMPFEFMSQDLMIAFEVTSHPSRLDGSTCWAAWNLRPAQSYANRMVTVCAGEGTRRGLFEIPDDEQNAELDFVSDRLEQTHGDALLIGSSSVSKATDQELLWAGQAALRRSTTLSALIEFMGSQGDQVFRIVPDTAPETQDSDSVVDTAE